MSKNNTLEPVLGSEEEEQEIKAPVKKRPGRPPGAKNKTTLFRELMQGKFEQIAEKNIKKTFDVLFEKAHEGDMQAIKLVLDRVIPASKAVDPSEASKKGGLTLNISIGELEKTPLVTGEVIEDAEFEEVE
jgi:hypothetical protein